MSHPTPQHREAGNLYNGDKIQFQNNCNDIGKELHPESIMWKLYVDEAREQDIEITTERNKSLDTLLIFATLYSAILTAFIIESIGLLKQDNAETTTALLLTLVQSQLRIETRSPALSPLQVEMPQFQPTYAARLINILWFTSLILSLGVVILTMLAKEWLHAFVSYRTRHTHEYTIQRQARLDSFDSWKMLTIIDFLPTLITFSLLLFLIGLITRLKLLDRVVADVVMVIATLSVALYVVFVILGAVVDTCPYKSKLSSHVKAIFLLVQSKYQHLRGRPTTKRSKVKHYVNQQDLYAVQWFLDNGRDPATIATAFQALAGLQSLNPVHFNIGNLGLGLTHGDVCQRYLKPYSTILQLGAGVLDRLKGATTNVGKFEIASYVSIMESAREIALLRRDYAPARELLWHIMGSERDQSLSSNFTRRLPPA